MNIRKAVIEDMDILIKLRLDFLIDDRGYLSHDQETAIYAQLLIYFEKHINRDFIATLAEKDGNVVSAAFLAITEKPANPSFINGITATLLNVYTYPEYRRMGIATKVISQLLEEAKKYGVSSIDLFATEPKCTAMRLQLFKT